VDHRADIYAVGVILYEALTGKPPFEDEDPVGILAAVLTRDPPRPRTLDATIPPGLELVIQTAMAKKPAERYQTMRALDRALADFDRKELSAVPVPPASAFEAAPSSAPLASLALPLRALRLWSSDASLAESARVRLAALSLAAVSCGFAALMELGTSILRCLRRDGQLTGTEIVLAALISTALLITPGIAWTRHLVAQVWSSTPRVLDLLARARRVLAASLIAYAVTLMAVRLFGGALRADASGMAWAGWGVVSSLAAISAGAGAAALPWLTARFRLDD
jgi:hypothetical protein